MSIKRYWIDAPAKSQYVEADDGEWCHWDDVSAELRRIEPEYFRPNTGNHPDHPPVEGGYRGNP